jgi:hypothetical protein
VHLCVVNTVRSNRGATNKHSAAFGEAADGNDSISLTTKVELNVWTSAELRCELATGRKNG